MPGGKSFKGFGDVLAFIFKKLGIKKKKGCGCDKRQEAINKFFPFK